MTAVRRWPAGLDFLFVFPLRPDFLKAAVYRNTSTKTPGWCRRQIHPPLPRCSCIDCTVSSKRSRGNATPPVKQTRNTNEQRPQKRRSELKTPRAAPPRPALRCRPHLLSIGVVLHVLHLRHERSFGGRHLRPRRLHDRQNSGRSRLTRHGHGNGKQHTIGTARQWAEGGRSGAAKQARRRRGRKPDDRAQKETDGRGFGIRYGLPRRGGERGNAGGFFVGA